MLGFLTFAQDQSIFTLIKAAYRIKVGNDTYRLNLHLRRSYNYWRNLSLSHLPFCRTCMEILNRKKEWKNDNLRKHFESGTCTGLGTANLVGSHWLLILFLKVTNCIKQILSHLPARALRTLKWAGFTGDRMEALRNLKNAAAIKDALRFKIVSLITISYNLYMEQFYGESRCCLYHAWPFVTRTWEGWSAMGSLSARRVGPTVSKWSHCSNIQGPTETVEWRNWPSHTMLPGGNQCSDWVAIHSEHLLLGTNLVLLVSRHSGFMKKKLITSTNRVKGNWSEAAKLAKLLRTKSHWSRCVMTTLVATPYLYGHDGQ